VLALELNSSVPAAKEEADREAENPF